MLDVCNSYVFHSASRVEYWFEGMMVVKEELPRKMLIKLAPFSFSEAQVTHLPP
jgi:hypothetical protein